jgi:hypothetical protein
VSAVAKPAAIKAAGSDLVRDVILGLSRSFR